MSLIPDGRMRSSIFKLVITCVAAYRRAVNTRQGKKGAEMGLWSVAADRDTHSWICPANSCVRPINFEKFCEMLGVTRRGCEGTAEVLHVLVFVWINRGAGE